MAAVSAIYMPHEHVHADFKHQKQTVLTTKSPMMRKQQNVVELSEKSRRVLQELPQTTDISHNHQSQAGGASQDKGVLSLQYRNQQRSHSPVDPYLNR